MESEDDRDLKQLQAAIGGMTFDEACALAAELEATEVKPLSVDPWIWWPGLWLVKATAPWAVGPYFYVYSPDHARDIARRHPPRRGKRA